MTTKNYYLIENGNQVGPFSYDELKLKKLNSDSFIWYDGLDKWSKIGEIPELLFLIEKTPPPFENNNNENSRIPPIPNTTSTASKESPQISKYEVASVWERLGGYLILNIIIVILFFAFGGDIADLEQSEGLALDLLYAGLGSGLINGIFYPFFSGNLGHKLLGLKVIDMKDNSPVKSIFSGFGREFLKGAFSIIIFPLLWILFDSNNQNLYDKIQGTLVIRNKN